MAEVFGVVGAGTMGNGIAQVAARAGFDVLMRDVAPDFLARGMTAIDKSEMHVARGVPPHTTTPLTVKAGLSNVRPARCTVAITLLSGSRRSLTGTRNTWADSP